jgi:PKHD-type hydroxylase
VLVHIPQVLNPEQLAECREVLATAEWVDGKSTSGAGAASVKRNRQLPEQGAATQAAQAEVTAALTGNAAFLSAALPHSVFPPLFNRYAGGQAFGNHVDNAIRQVPGRMHRVRTDLSATLFLSRPEEYDGGELVTDDTYGAHRIKLPAGDMILYPGTSLHRVEPVTSAVRLAAFFWVQSMVRADSQRALLFALDTAIQQLAGALPDSPAVAQLFNVYHNLLRQWADT